MWWNLIFQHYALLIVLMASNQAFSQSSEENPFAEIFGRCRCAACNYRGNEDMGRHTINVAFNKPGIYKTVLEGYAPACAAVNGDRSHIEKKGLPYNCIHTGSPLNEPLNHWVEYDLLDVYTIDTVTLYRSDKNDGNPYDTIRLRGYDITVDGEVCWSSVGYYDDSMNALHEQLVQILECLKPVTGQVVRFGKRQEYHKDKQNQYLVFCEVVIWVCTQGFFGNPATGCNRCPSLKTCNYLKCDNYYGCNTLVTWNAAIKRLATQSSVSKGGPDNAVDGGLLADDPNDCTIIDRVQDDLRNSWWQVDLGRLFRIMLVKITNRQDCCGDRLQNFLVLVNRETVNFTRSYQRKETCHEFSGNFTTGETKSLDCEPPLVGRYVSIVARHPYILQFCEVRPYGYFIEEILPGGDCSAVTSSKYCVEGTMCIGNKCSIGLGGSCLGNNSLHCKNGTACEEGICVLAVMAFCAGSPFKCVTGAICDQKSQSTCKIKLDGSCEDSASCIFGAICDHVTKKCRIPVEGNCGSSPALCQYRASCDVNSGYICKWGFNIPCENTNECKNGLVCDFFKRCKKPIGHNCTDFSECIGGTSCESSKCYCAGRYSSTSLCDPHEGRASGPCSPHVPCVEHSACTNDTCKCEAGYDVSGELFICKLSMGSACQTSDECTAGLVCDSQRCRMENGNNCMETSLCKTDSHCDNHVCKIKPGKGCSTFPQLCGMGSVCINGFCKRQLKDTCDLNNDYCTTGTMCSKSPEDKTPICRLSPGISCAGQNKTLCVDTAVCDEDNVCKVKLGKSCATPYQNYCTNGTKCESEKCRHSLGSDCNHDDECEQGTVCDLFHFQCRLEADRPCAALLPNDMCSSGAVCSIANKCTCFGYGATVRKEGKCEPANKKIGGKCNAFETRLNQTCDDPYAHCASDYYKKPFACQCFSGYEVERTDYTCGAGAGTICANVKTGVICNTGLTCDLRGLCSLEVGQRCKGENRRWCKTGAICEQDMCKVNFNQDCSGSRHDKCKSGTICDILSRCKFPGNSPCSTVDVCVAGARCENNKFCQCDSKITRPAGDICEAADGVVTGKCKSSSCNDPYARCTEQQTCECQEGYTVQSSDLSCKISVGYNCSISEPLCTAGTTCDSTRKQCSLELGQFCGNGNANRCVTGGVCDFNLECKLSWNETCNSTVAYLCKHGTSCDWYQRCKVGVTHLCNYSSDCVAGATCVDSICRCVETDALQNGYICEPKSGYIGGSCDDVNKCISKGSNCTNQICYCESGFLVSDDGFHCVPATEETGQFTQSSTEGLPLLLIIAPSAVLCVGICIALTVTLIRKKAKPAQEVTVVKTDKDQLSRAMGVAYGVAPAGETDLSQKSVTISETINTAASEVNSTAASGFTSSTTSDATSTTVSDATSTAVNGGSSSTVTSDIASDEQSQSEESVTDIKKEEGEIVKTAHPTGV